MAIYNEMSFLLCLFDQVFKLLQQAMKDDNKLNQNNISILCVINFLIQAILVIV